MLGTICQLFNLSGFRLPVSAPPWSVLTLCCSPGDAPRRCLPLLGPTNQRPKHCRKRPGRKPIFGPRARKTGVAVRKIGGGLFSPGFPQVAARILGVSGPSGAVRQFDSVRKFDDAGVHWNLAFTLALQSASGCSGAGSGSTSTSIKRLSDAALRIGSPDLAGGPCAPPVATPNP
jgi:hypothetical protein